MTKISTIAAFDFDGTMTYRDTFFPFLIFAKGVTKASFLIAQEIPALFSYLLGRMGRQELKERFLKRFFAGMPGEELQRLGETYALGPLSKKIKPQALEQLRWHQKQGHRCLLVSAAIDIYLKPWSEKMGFDNLLCSEVAADAQGRITGTLKGTNCRGEEKVRRLKNLLGPRSDYLLYAYGDSPGDHEMLLFADYPFYCTFKGNCS